MNASIPLLLGMTALFGCAPQEENQQSAREISRASEKEVREYLDKAMLVEVSYIRLRDSLEWEYLNDYFVTAEANDGDHLIELSTECADLRARTIYNDMVDRRYNAVVVSAGQDTIRGCRIKTIYRLPEVDGLADSTGNPDALQ